MALDSSSIGTTIESASNLRVRVVDITDPLLTTLQSTQNPYWVSPQGSSRLLQRSDVRASEFFSVIDDLVLAGGSRRAAEWTARGGNTNEPTGYVLIGTRQEDVIGIKQRFLTFERIELLFLDSRGHMGLMHVDPFHNL